jgi:hypothetical protein
MKPDNRDWASKQVIEWDWPKPGVGFRYAQPNLLQGGFRVKDIDLFEILT